MYQPIPFIFFLLSIMFGCSNGAVAPITTPYDPAYDQVRLEKLIGTPFEGETNADSFSENYFLCGPYQTLTIEVFPIQIFAAFFTPREEDAIQDGIDLANAGLGFQAYELTDVWSDTARIIYRISDLSGSGAAQTFASYQYFNGNSVTENEAIDWTIGFETRTVIFPQIVAHELGHASGILGHQLINYETGETSALEAGSIMRSPSGSQVTDYNYMMQKQGEIMNQHLGETGTLNMVLCP